MQRRGIITQRPSEKHRLKAGRMLGRDSSQMGPMSGLELGTEQNLA